MVRPGTSFISAAYASELFIGLLHHPLGNGTPNDSKEEGALGILPAHIRGSLSDFDLRLCYGTAFEK